MLGTSDAWSMSRFFPIAPASQCIILKIVGFLEYLRCITLLQSQMWIWHAILTNYNKKRIQKSTSWRKFFEVLIYVGMYLFLRVLSRFFDRVGHGTPYASSENKHFFTISHHCQTYHKYQQSRQKLATFSTF